MAVKFNNVSYLDKLNNVNCVFKKNRITFLLGESGAGKSLLSYLITGLIVPTKGTITINDNLINKNNLKKIRKNIGYVFQNPEEEFFSNTVKEELEFSFKKYKYNESEINKQVIKVLKLVGLDKELFNQNPFKLSSGEKEKLALAIALSLDPEILILDEPTVYLDDKSINDLVKLLIKLKKDYNKTIIIISNNINFITLLADDIIILKEGKINLNISKKELLEDIGGLEKNKIEIPKIVEFITLVNKYKNKNISYTTSIDKLVKEIKKNV